MNKKDCCTKKELAMAYAPGVSYDTAKHRLQRWIKRNPRLAEALQKAGYQDTQKMLNAEQVQIIFKFLGKPCQPTCYQTKKFHEMNV